MSDNLTLDDILPATNGYRPVSDMDFSDEVNYEMFDRIRSGLGNLEDDAFYTEDMPQLMNYDWHYLFTYGTLREGFSRSTTLRGSPFVGFATTQHAKFCMLTTKGASPFPVVFLDPRKEYQGRIFGEVYKVRPSTVRRLDFLESNGTLYKRVLTSVRVVTDEQGNTRDIYAWMYRGIKEYWATRQQSLEHSKKIVPNKPGADPYYLFFNNQEYGM